MKLRKALDKARLEIVVNNNNNITNNNGGHGSSAITTKQNGAKKISDAWQEPVYVQSKRCQLDSVVTEKNRGVCLQSNSEEIERYKILRTRINHKSTDRPVKTVMVTSPHNGDGKTTTAINMAFTFARALDHTVLLVDCDLKNQSVHKYLGIESHHNIIDHMLDDIPLDELIIWPGVDKLTLISGNRMVEDTSELLSSPMMEKLVKEVSSRYDDRYVFFDAPPLLDRAEAISMTPLVDGIIMVVAAGVTSKRDVKAAVDLLPRDKFLGFVLNKQG